MAGMDPGLRRDDKVGCVAKIWSRTLRDSVLPGIDLDDGQGRGTTGTRLRGVDFDREAAGRVGLETELGDGIRGDTLFDVVTVEVQGQGPIAAPPQFYTVALVNTDQLHRVGDPAPLDPDVEGQLGRADAAGEEQQ